MKPKHLPAYMFEHGYLRELKQLEAETEADEAQRREDEAWNEPWTPTTSDE
jgi:hypothetical protein